MIREIISSLLYHAPFLLIQVAALGGAVVGWRKHPRMSLFLTVGVGIAFIHAFLFMILLPVISNFSGMWYLTGGRLVRIASTLMSACSYAVIAASAFVGFQEGQKRAAGK